VACPGRTGRDDSHTTASLRLAMRRSSPASLKSIALILASTGIGLVAYALIVAFVIQPPALGWLGFAIMASVLLGLVALAPVVFELTRVSAQRPADWVDRDRRLLVIADAACNEEVLCEEISARIYGVVAVHLVVPVRVSLLHFLTDDESKEWREARQTMLTLVGRLQRRGLSATGSVGSDKPLESMTDALGSFPATHVLLATPPAEESYWLERDLLARARALTTVPVTQVVVSSHAAIPAKTRASSES
jgi:hypothetical protein